VTENTTVPAAVIVGCIYIFSSLPIFAVARKLASQGTNQLAIKRERERERERETPPTGLPHTNVTVLR
jgi:hypothetical protein